MSNQDIQTFLSQWSEAERRGDRSALAPLLAEDFVGVGPLGFTLPKEAWLNRFGPEGLKYDRFELDELQVHNYGETAMVVARLNQPGSFQGNPIPAATRATMTIVDQPEGRKLAGIAMTFIAGTPGAPPIPGSRPQTEKS